MRIVNWNCAGINNKYTELSQLSVNSDIICLSETKLNKSKKFFCPNGFNFIRKDRNDDSNGGGIITLINNKLQYSDISLDFSNHGIEVQGIKIFKGPDYFNIFLISLVYMKV